MPEDTPEEKPFDATDPSHANPLFGALDGLSIEEFITKATTPSDTPKPADKKAEGTGVTGEKVEEQKPDTKKPEASDDEDITTLLAIDPASLKTKGGVPAAESSRQQFKSLQSALKAKDEKFKAALKELEEAKAKAGPPLEEQEGYKNVLTERENLKKELDLINFENSHEWKETFVTPIKSETERVSNILAALKTEPEDKQAILVLIREAENLLGDPKNEVEYSDIVDKVSADYMKPNTASKFSRAMENLFDLSAKRATAYTDKEKARQTIVEAMTKKTGSAAKSLQDRLEIELMAFEKTDIGQIFKKTPEFDLDSTSKANKEKVLAAMRDYNVTGQVTNDMADMVKHYSLKGAFEKERNWLVTNYLKLGTAVETLLAEKEELQKRVNALRGEGKETVTQTKPGTNGGKTDYTARGILGEEFDKLFVGR